MSRTKREAALFILEQLQRAGETAYLAGGCVRDDLLGAEPKDFDIATSARPDRVLSLFPKARYVGEAFGVMLVRKFDHAIEVATFRTEWGYEDGRRPSHVEFSDEQHDAQRRDFTINGIFENPLAQDPRQRVIDYVGGQRDLSLKLIRAIGDPGQRFAEDYLRLLRAVRFASRLGFEIEAETRGAIRTHAQKLAQISRERVGQEIRGMIGVHTPRALALVEELSLDVGTLNEPHEQCSLRTIQRMAAPVSTGGAMLGWMLDRAFDALPAVEQSTGEAAWLEREQQALAQRVQHWRLALCLSNPETDAMLHGMRCLTIAGKWPSMPLAGKKRLLADPGWKAAAPIVHAWSQVSAQKQHWQGVHDEAAVLLAQGVSPPPLVKGHDLLAVGIPSGVVLGQLLNRVYDEQLEGRVTTREQAMIWIQQQQGG